MTSHPGTRMIALQILSNISRSKGNKTMLFDQLIDYNVRNVFLENSRTKFDVETTLRRFSKKSKLSIPLDQYPKV